MHVDRPHIGSEQDIRGVTGPVERMTLIWGEILDGLRENERVVFVCGYVTGSFQTSTDPAHLFLQAMLLYNYTS